MSLVLGYVTQDHAIIMSDGRAGKDGCVSEHYNKTVKINDNIILGFVGFLEPVEFFLKQCISQMGTDRNDYFVDDFAEMLEFFFSDSETRTRLKSSFLILGRARDSSIHSIIAGNLTNYAIEDTLVATPRVLQIGGSVEGSRLNDIYYRNINLFIDGKIDIIDAMSRTIVEASHIDSSINSNVFTVRLNFI